MNGAYQLGFLQLLQQFIGKFITKTETKATKNVALPQLIHLSRSVLTIDVSTSEASSLAIRADGWSNHEHRQIVERAWVGVVDVGRASLGGHRLVQYQRSISRHP